MKYKLLDSYGKVINNRTGEMIVEIRGFSMDYAITADEIEGGEGHPIKVKIPCDRYKEKEE